MYNWVNYFWHDSLLFYNICLKEHVRENVHYRWMNSDKHKPGFTFTGTKNVILDLDWNESIKAWFECAAERRFKMALL